MHSNNTNFATFSSFEKLKNEIGYSVANHYGRQVIVTTPPTKEDMFIELGYKYSKIIRDDYSNNFIIRYIDFDDILHLPIHIKNEKFVIFWEDYGTFNTRLLEKYNNMLSEGEKTILRIANTKLSKSRLVDIGLNPIREIFEALIAFPEGCSKKNIDDSHKKYVPFLKNLDYIELNNSRIIKGNKFQSLEVTFGGSIESEDFLNILIGDVIYHGFPYLKEKKRINHLTPLLRLTNTNYISSLMSNRRTHFKIDDFLSSMKSMYHSSHSYLKTNSYLKELTRIDLLEKTPSNYYLPSKKVFEEYSSSVEFI